MRFNPLVRQFFGFGKSKPNFGKYALVSPGRVSPRKTVPHWIPKPSYHETGVPLEAVPSPEVKNGAQIGAMRESCRLAATILSTVGESLQMGQTTDEIDCLVHELCIQNGAYPSPLNYHNFPKSVCTSVNNVACHGIPDDRALADGDIINIDVTVFYKGYHGDCSGTFLIGEVDEAGKRLVRATEQCLDVGIGVCHPGVRFQEIGRAIEAKAAELGYRVVPAFLGHGIGAYFHGPPEIYHIENDYPGVMEAGMTFTIEPILTQGGELIDIMPDDWTAITADNARTAQFEHTVLVTPSGVDVLTVR